MGLCEHSSADESELYILLAIYPCWW